MAALRIIRPFDPWNSPFCTCPDKFSLNPYTGCGHRCLYCYVTYVPSFFSPRRKKKLLENCEKDVMSLPKGSLISISNSTDPYQPDDELYEDSRKVLQILSNHDLRILIITKSDLVLRDIDLIGKMRCAVMITVTTLREEISQKLEPKSPPPHRRLLALCKLSQNGIPCGIRIDPIIPGLNDNEIEEIVDEAKKAGVSHITTSTYKARRENLIRIVEAFPYLKRGLEKLYIEKGKRFGSTFFLDRNLREEIVGRVKAEASSKGITFSSCREGLSELNSSLSCDGSHMIDYAKPLRKDNTFFPNTE